MSSEEMEKNQKKHYNKAKKFLHDCFRNYGVCRSVIEKGNTKIVKKKVKEFLYMIILYNDIYCQCYTQMYIRLHSIA